jgi:predicted ATPase
MAGEARRGCSSHELDPELLAVPFEHTTNWHVITGAPSCGKTTLVDLLTERGFPTVEECARRYLESELSSGRTIDEIHTHGAALQRRLLDIKMTIEAGLPPSEVFFLDCAVPGSIAWYRLFGLDPNEALRHCFRHRYSSVFVLDPLPLTPDGVRFEDDDFTGFLDEWIARDYEALGYDIVRVPVMAPDDRLAYVLERVPTPALDTR